MTAVAHDNPIPGFDTRNTINLRLWSAKPDKEFDLEAFNTGDYVQARSCSNCVACTPALLAIHWPPSMHICAQPVSHL